MNSVVDDMVDVVLGRVHTRSRVGGGKDELLEQANRQTELEEAVTVTLDRTVCTIKGGCMLGAADILLTRKPGWLKESPPWAPEADACYLSTSGG